MAKIKISKPDDNENEDETKKKGLKPRVIKSGDENNDDDGEDGDDEESEEEDAEQPEKKESKAATVSVKKPSNADDVRIVMHRRVPSPRIGHHHVQDIIGSPTMLPKKTYTVPRDVGNALEDQGACSVIRETDV